MFEQCKTYQWREGIPRPKGDEEAKPREEEDAAVHVERVQERNGASLAVYRVDLWGPKGQHKVDHRDRLGYGLSREFSFVELLVDL